MNTNCNFNTGTLWHPTVQGLIGLGLEADATALRGTVQSTGRKFWFRRAVSSKTRKFNSKVRQRSLKCLMAFSAGLLQRDPDLHAHSERVAHLSLRLAHRLGLGARETQSLQFAALLHDCGKISLDPCILNKPGALSDDEFSLVKRHPQLGDEFLCCAPFLHDARPGVRYHHEYFDGSGYPEGLRGEEIPLAARIIGIADAFDAMTNDRPYRPRLDTEHACDILRRRAGTQFDPQLVEEFIALPPEARHFDYCAPQHLSS
ncbi:MAG TPA: HD-GYP domain-containing protein [Abditibacteriaceae bacterium]